MAPAIYRAKPCPRCGSNVIGFIKTGQDLPQFFAICRHCFRYGETAANRDDALARWNSDPARCAAGTA
jgi:ribosomal protein S14